MKSQHHKAYRWNRKRYSRLRRSFDIWAFVLGWSSALWLNDKPWSYPGGMTEAKKEARRRRQAIWTRETFLELGPTFIKVGQLFSTRADLFPVEYVEELSKLQDRVPAFDYDQVETILEEDLGKPLRSLFKSFDPIPLAAASLGQVHKAQLPSGEEIVVKVQRPGLKKLFQIDLSILKDIARYFQSHPRWGPGRDWLGIYEECCRILYEEIDYLNEGRNADRFRRNFRHADWVKVPRIFWRYASPRILVMEYMPGIKISHYEALETAGLERSRLASLGAQAYLEQLLASGFFHADPHPGNLAVCPEDGALIFYDFGMMGQINPITREKLLDVFFGVAQKDGTRVMNSLIELGALQPTGDTGPIRRSIQYMLDNFMDQPFEEQSVDSISEDLYEIAYGQPFRFPATFTFVMRAFSTLEGVGKGLDPEFNFMEVAKPYAVELMNGNGSGPDTSGLLGELSRQAAQVSTTALGLPRRIDDTIEKLEQGDLRLRVRSIETDRALRKLGQAQIATNYAILTGSFGIGTAILIAQGLAWVAAIAGVLTIIPGITCLRLLRRIDRYDKML